MQGGKRFDLPMEECKDSGCLLWIDCRILENSTGLVSSFLFNTAAAKFDTNASVVSNASCL